MEKTSKHELALMLALSLLGAVVLGGCSEKEKMREKLAPLCERASEMLADGNLDSDSFMLSLENALKACSGACDAEDDGSCKHLQAHLEKLSRAMPDAATSFCADASGSLKKYSCEIAAQAKK
jgi:hypothetical protein